MGNNELLQRLSESSGRLTVFLLDNLHKEETMQMHAEFEIVFADFVDCHAAANSKYSALFLIDFLKNEKEKIYQEKYIKPEEVTQVTVLFLKLTEVLANKKNRHANQQLN